MTVPAVRAVVFDVFGTLVDWRSGVAREVRRVLGPAVDGEAFADAWRARYAPQMAVVRRGERPFADLDVLQAESLGEVLDGFGLEADDVARRELVLAWHRLDAWPEVPGALARLRERFWVAPLSNGHVALSVALARRNGLVWDAVLGAGYSRAYKPDAAVYRDAAAAFGLAPAEVMLVACHSSDLEAAAAAGLRTGHVARPREHGPGGGETAPTVPTDLAAGDLEGVAEALL